MSENGISSIWDRIVGLRAALAQCITDKLSARQAAEKISELAGKRMSRNSLIGYARRMGLNFDGKRVPSGLKRPRKQFANPNWVYRKPTAPEPISEVPIDPGFLGLKLEQLENNQCRYPHGEGPFLFCGQPADGSWCEYHKTIVFNGFSKGFANVISGTQTGSLPHGGGSPRSSPQI